MNVRPLHDRVLVKRLAAEDKTSGGFLIPDTAKEKPLEALVVSGGNGKDHIILREDDILRDPREVGSITWSPRRFCSALTPAIR